MNDGSTEVQSFGESTPIAPDEMLAKRIDLLAKAGGFVLLLLYGLGYLTTSLHFARLGMPLASPFRPRVATAGFIYLALSAPFLWLSLRLFSPLNQLTSARQHYAALASTAVFFFSMCALISVLIAQIFVFDSTPTDKQSLAYMSLCIFGLLLSPYSIRRIGASWQDKHPFLSFGGSILLLLLLIMCSVGAPYFAPSGFGIRHVASWFFAVGVIPWGLIKRSRFADQSIQQNWALVAIQLLLFLGIFPVVIYPHIKAEWGGGQPVDATILYSKSSILLPGRLLKVKMLDENEYGFYYCPKTCGQPIFSSRESVAAVVYAKDAANIPQ